MSRQLTAAEDILARIADPGPGHWVRMVDVARWETPVSDLPSRTIGDVRITHEKYPPGFYRMEGVTGAEAYRLLAPLDVTVLQGVAGGVWRTWMVDDPLHWAGMYELVQLLPPGRILCAGLGLGLVVHRLVARADITAITVVERSQQVIELVAPSLPDDPRVQVVVESWEAFLAEHVQPYDGIFWDLTVGEQDDVIPALEQAAELCERHMPGVPLVRFGIRDQSAFR